MIFQTLQRFKNVIITSDFNIDLLKCKDNSHINQYLDNVIANSYVPKITFPTRLTHNHGTLIDNILMKLNDRILECKSGILLNRISDHLPYFIKLQCFQHQNVPNKIQINHNRPDAHECFQNYLVESNITLKLNASPTGDPEDNYKILNDIIKIGYDKFFGGKMVKYNKYKHRKSAWISYGIIRSIRFRDKLYKDLKKTSSDDATFESKRINFQTYRSILKKCIRTAKKNYYFYCFEKCKSNIKATWNNINLILNRYNKKSDFPKYFLVNGNYISDPLQIANEFNLYFTKIGPELANKIDILEDHSYMDYLNIPIYSKFTFTPVTMTDVIKVINGLKTKASRGIDMISNKLLKIVKNEISEPLTIIINQALNNGVFPKPLKIAKVIPLFKKDQDFLFNNYRPVSILSSLSKVFEKIMFMQIYNYFNENN